MLKGMTLTQFLLKQKRTSSGIDENIIGLMEGVATIAKVISREVSQAGLIDLLGYQGDINVHGEQVQKLDAFANTTFINVLGSSGFLTGMASEEIEDFYAVPEGTPRGNYLLSFDPLDGSSNIDVNVSVGSIFSIHKKISSGDAVSVTDFLQKGRDQVGAGYVIYGPSTMLIFSLGSGVQGFTLDTSIGEFLLSHENIKIPIKGKIYSINEGYAFMWEERIKKYVDGAKKEGKTLRYVGSLVADFHRNLLKGGLFLYPADSKNPQGKLRLLYEASPLAFIVEQAGGAATTGSQPILDLLPEKLHQRVPLIIGSINDVKQVEAC